MHCLHMTEARSSTVLLDRVASDSPRHPWCTCKLQHVMFTLTPKSLLRCCFSAENAAAGAESIQTEAKPQRQSLFQDEQLNSFFRRLSWSPDGT